MSGLKPKGRSSPLFPTLKRLSVQAKPIYEFASFCTTDDWRCTCGHEMANIHWSNLASIFSDKSPTTDYAAWWAQKLNIAFDSYL